ncbi:hypothetical protein IQ06DRAFT_348916 [Phaeosphaeriaceae sp. SRC1lsM3a]|nr:hypothetical protein IQ06DRAFT_348916 [Stagonospora sp. SRC1lsM3a]
MKFSIAQKATILALLTQANAYNCWRNTNNAARWDDISPADRARELCRVAGTGERCHNGKIGRMCIDGPGTDAFCDYIWGWTGSQQSWHDNWFLWADITCDGGVLGTADDVHIRML